LGDVSSGAGVSIVRAPDVLPLRPESVRALAVDAAHATERFLASSVAALRPSGRLLLPVASPLPDGVVERARDAHDRLGEKQDLTTLERAPRPLR
ncbi:MAG TPA: hypothetical protein VFU90_14720, partial [Candidatus Tumulicola sp.]|nr:hypothetical protein [Candidatus Tumulicola sp.]